MKKHEFTVQGKPVGKQRPRFGRNGRIYTPQQTKDYESKVAIAAAHAVKEPFTERGVTVVVRMYFSTKVHSDLDNVLKSVMDGMNGVAYVDDRLVDEVHGYIHYVDSATEQRVEVEVFSENE